MELLRNVFYGSFGEEDVNVVLADDYDVDKKTPMCLFGLNSAFDLESMLSVCLEMAPLEVSVNANRWVEMKIHLRSFHLASPCQRADAPPATITVRRIFVGF